MKNFFVWIAVSIGSLFGIHSQPANIPVNDAPVQQVVQADNYVPNQSQSTNNTASGSTLSITDPKDVKDFDTCMSYAKNIPTNFDIVFAHGSDIQDVTNVEADFQKAYPQAKLKVSTEQDAMDEAVAYNGGSIKTASGLADYKKQITPQLTSKISVSIPLQYLGTKKNFDDFMSTILSKYPRAKFQQYAGSSPETFLSDSSVSVGEAQYVYQQQCTYKYKTPLAPVTVTPGATIPTTAQAQAIGKNARIKADIVQLRIMAELAQANSHTFANVCQNGLVNTTAYKDLPALVQDIISTQGANNQAGAGLVCVSMQDKYAFGIQFSSATALPGITSYCLDSTGYGGDNTKYILNKSIVSCKAVQ